MFRAAQLKLTFFYSALFLLLFWAFSFGLYFWMEGSFGEGYISQVKQRQGQYNGNFDDKNAAVVTIAGDVAMDQLLTVLIFLNSGLFVVIPIASWFLAKRTLAPVQDMHEQQKQFVSDASHEMRTPLAIMSGELEVTLNKERTAGEYKKALVSTKEETNRLANLVENLLFLAKEDRNATSIQTETVDITDVLSRVTQSLQSKAKKKKITITMHTDDVSTPTVAGHSGLLYQLFYNLLDNAIIYTVQNGRITLLLSEQKNNIIVAVEDTGIGIEKKHLEKITERFYRVDAARSQIKGYGLGLSIVQAVIQKHKGQLHIRSELQKGSVFTIVLPKA